MWVYKLPQHSGKKASKYPEAIPSSSPFQKQETLQSDDTHAEKERVGICNNNLPIIITSARNKVRIIIIDKLNPRRSSLSSSLLVQSVSHLLDPSSNSCNASFQGLEGRRRKRKKEEEDFCHENAENVPLCRRYTDVHYAVLRRRVHAIFQRRRRAGTTTELAAQHPPLLLFSSNCDSL